ncbi:hypothetical protein LKL35_36615 [Streptomyces sp. ET3-23]|uniref:hypothetical protein n=1 Tax=Streptomyces sp. ET3-23 TaxID=2885643 RepID=UPI001D0F746E|nr:hypothetical protein [Streptomyces sp. ET3-23]MCC2280853.1 hypothetical protein [Streptomyces sp. ET3-23]
MDTRRMRRLCTYLLRNLGPETATVEGLFTALCSAMSTRCGRPVSYRPVAFPVGTVSGLWVATDTQHLILIEESTVPEHQLVILGHELWHIESHEGETTPIGAAEASHLLAPQLKASDVRRIAQRATARSHVHQSDQEELACEMFGSILGSKAGKMLALDNQVGVADTSAKLAARLQVSLGSLAGPGGAG